MTSRWPIFSSAVGVVALASCLQAATLSGSIVLRDSGVDAVRQKKDYSGVVISLEPVTHPAFAVPAKHVVMLQKNKMFYPHILPVLAGTAVDFPNGDPIFHNAFSSYSGQVFDVGLYPPGTSRSVRFQRPGVVRVFCNIHPAMSSVVVVLNTPYFATTSLNGSFRLDVPPGTYDLHVFHERATEEKLATLTRRVIVGADGLQLPAIDVSEAGYLPAPHKNKYGKEYDPPPDDKLLYPGVRE